jgi:glucose-6-phosphate isomerase
MGITLYDGPTKIELVGHDLFVDGNRHPRTTRIMREMRKTLLSYSEAKGNNEAYFMYRNVYREGELRFDITVIPAAHFGDECAKTHGHYHPGSEDGPGYPEVYQVLHGSAVFILQKKNRNGSVNVTMVNAEKGETVLLPPGYGHVTVNKGEDVLVLSNLVYDRFESLYGDYAANQGAAYYYLAGGEIRQNSNYIVEKNERVSAKEFNSRYGFSCDDLLLELQREPKNFEFLMKPGLLQKK